MLSVDKASTRERSLGAALAVVRAEGAEALTTRAIARRSGLTQPAIYRHFASKGELVGEVLAVIRERFHARLVAATAAPEPRARLDAALETIRAFAVEEPHLFDALFFQNADAAAIAAPRDGRPPAHIFGFLVERVRECAEAGIIRPGEPVRIALTLAAHSQGVILLHRQGRFASVERFTDFYRRSLEDVLRGLR